VPQEIASTVYRITQEALRNIARHSGARTASVLLDVADDSLILTIRDTGSGFSVDTARAQPGLGLTSMEERARMPGGTFEITSRPGKGTIIRVQIPWIRSRQ
jgi:signal transduction histidine kinase